VEARFSLPILHLIPASGRHLLTGIPRCAIKQFAKVGLRSNERPFLGAII